MTMTYESEVHTLAIPYALHALPEYEVEQFQLHLETCASCRDEIDDLHEVAARLGLAESRQPPEDLRRRVLDEIATVRPLPPVIDDSTPKLPRPAVRRWWPRIATGVAAALLVVVGVLTSVIVDQSQRLDDDTALQAAIGRVAAAPDMSQATASTEDGKVIVMLSRAQDTAVVLPFGMETPPEGKDYQVWFMRDGQVRSAGLLPADDGSARPLSAGDLDDATAIGITVEPDGGSEQPTAKPLMVIDIPA